MTKIYQYNAASYYAGEAEDYGLLPNNATRAKPTLKEGFIPRWTGERWEQVENHKGKTGYVNGEPHTVTEYGPLPEGWSDTPPPPTPEEEKQLRINEIKSRLNEIDLESVRPLRAKAYGTATPEDDAKLAALEQEAETLRAELAGFAV